MKSSSYWDIKWSACKVAEAPNNFAKRCYRLIHDKGFKTLLELGYGAGGDALFFARKGFTVTAVDISPTALRALHAANAQIHVFKKDMTRLHMKPNSFEVVYAHLSLHYFNDRTTDAIFNMVARILKKGGYFFVKCKSVDDALYGKGKKVGGDMFKKGHTRHFFSKEYMRKKLAPFAIIQVRRSSSTYHRMRSSFIEAVAVKS